MNNVIRKQDVLATCKICSDISECEVLELKNHTATLDFGIFGEGAVSLWINARENSKATLDVCFQPDSRYVDYDNVIRLPIEYCPFCGKKLADIYRE